MSESSYYKLYAFSIFAIIVFGMIDGAATNFLVGGGHCYETNPIIEALQQRYGILTALLIMKVPAIFLIACLGLYTRPPSWAAYSMLVIAGIYGLVLAWHIYIICSVF